MKNDEFCHKQVASDYNQPPRQIVMKDFNKTFDNYQREGILCHLFLIEMRLLFLSRYLMNVSISL